MCGSAVIAIRVCAYMAGMLNLACLFSDQCPGIQR